MSKLPTLWFSHLKNKDDKDHFEKTILNTLHKDPVVKKLKEILRVRVDALSRSERSLQTYENPSWSHRQAHVNGSLAELKAVLDLLEMPE